MDVDGDPTATNNINALDSKAIDVSNRLEAAGAAQGEQRQQRRQQQKRQSGGDGANAQAQAHAAHNDERWWLSEGETDDDEDGEDGSSDDGSFDDEDGRGGRRRKAKGSGGEGEGAGDAPPSFYDPNADEADDRWAAKQRGGRVTDALLSCPGCFTTVCLECQQHATLHTRYRAVFTVNCVVRRDAPVAVAGSAGGGAAAGGGRGRKRRDPYAAGGDGGGGSVQPAAAAAAAAVEYPIECEVCGTRLGLVDADDIVHFDHVLASNA